MGVVIKQTTVIEDNGFSAIKNAGLAGKTCIERAGIDKTEVGLLINVGVIRDQNIVEPSVASLIQREIGLSLDIGKESVGPMCFSFDVINGCCGFLNGVQIADSFLRNGTVKYALIVAADAHPSMTDHPDFPYVAIGAAALLTFDESDGVGFMPIKYVSDMNGGAKVEAYSDVLTTGDKGRGMLSFAFDEGYKRDLLTLSTQQIQALLESEGVDQVKYFIGSDLEQGFVEQTLEATSLMASGAQPVSAYHRFNGDPHTATPIAAFDMIRDQIKAGDRVLFSLVGSGNTSACCLYQA